MFNCNETTHGKTGRDMKHRFAAILAIVALASTGGCGTGAKARAKENMENSKAAYEKCLQQYPDDPSRCEALKKAFEADWEAYRQAGTATAPTVTGFFEFGLGGSGK